MSGTIAILQARMGSQRLPGKVLLDLAGQPMLARVVERTRRAESLDKVVVATTTDAIDEPIVELCSRRGWDVFRGSPDDLLDRYYRVAALHQAKTVVRITCDCPLIDPGIVDRVVRFYERDSGADYVSSGLPPRTFPRGLELEAFSFTALERAWREDTNPAWREHVTPYIYRHPELFKVARFSDGEDRSSLRLTVDTPQDFELVRRIYASLGHDRASLREIAALLDSHSDWLEINREVVQKEVS